MEYQIHDFSTNNVSVCDGQEALIRWFAKTVRPDIHGKPRIGAFGRLAMNHNDTMARHEWNPFTQESTVKKVARTLMVMDEHGRIIDPRLFEKEIFEFLEVSSKRRHWGRRASPWETYEFRRGPVPHISKGGSYNWYRAPKTTQERRMGCIVEHQPFFRKARNTSNIPDAYDDISRTVTRSWKQKRIKKQWMKNIQ